MIMFGICREVKFTVQHKASGNMSKTKQKWELGSRSMYLFTKEDLRVIGDGFNEPQLKIFWCKFGPISLSFLQDPAQPNPNSAISRSIKMAWCMIRTNSKRNIIMPVMPVVVCICQCFLSCKVHFVVNLLLPLGTVLLHQLLLHQDLAHLCVLLCFR